MLDLELDEQYQDLVHLVRDFAQQVVAPQSAANDAQKSFPYDIVKQMGELGLFGLPISEEYGGSGGDYFHLALALEELGKVDQSVAITLEAGVSLGAMPLFRFGSQEQKLTWLPELATGEKLAGFGLTEPGAGSDASATLTRARLDEGQWVIDGAKEFITNSGTDITSLVTVTAVTGLDETTGEKQISAIIVPSGTPGFSVAPAYNKVGWRASDTHPLHFDGARVPQENLLGEPGRGYSYFLEILDEGRIAIAALATGAAQGCLDEAVAYAKTRTTFGTAIAANQAISFMLARMATRVHLARLAYYAAAAKMLAGKNFKVEAAHAKLVGSEAAMDNARDATQIFGGYGFMNDSLVARHYRDSKILEIGEGTSQVQQLLIARSLGL